MIFACFSLQLIVILDIFNARNRIIRHMEACIFLFFTRINVEGFSMLITYRYQVYLRFKIVFNRINVEGFSMLITLPGIASF